MHGRYFVDSSLFSKSTTHELRCINIVEQWSCVCLRTQLYTNTHACVYMCVCQRGRSGGANRGWVMWKSSDVNIANNNEWVTRHMPLDNERFTVASYPFLSDTRRHPSSPHHTHTHTRIHSHTTPTLLCARPLSLEHQMKVKTFLTCTLPETITTIQHVVKHQWCSHRLDH